MRGYPVLGGIAVLLAACAQTPAPAPQPTTAVAVAPRADGLDYFVGAWTGRRRRIRRPATRP